MGNEASVQLQRKTTKASAESGSLLTAARATGGLLQRSCQCGGKSGTNGDCAECSRKKLSRSATSQGSAGRNAPPIVGEVLRGPGRALDDTTRDFMEPRFGHDFGKVRIHTGERAAESASAVGALAYTVGHDVVFGAGQYQPGTAEGRRLLAHELTHVVQGGQGSETPRAAASLEVSRPTDPMEVEAEQTAARVASGAAVAESPRPVQQFVAGVAARQVSGGMKLYRAPAPEEEEERPTPDTPAAETPEVNTDNTDGVGGGEGEAEEMQGGPGRRPPCQGSVSVPPTQTPAFNFGQRFRFPLNDNDFFCLNQMSLQVRFQNTRFSPFPGRPQTYTMELVRQVAGGGERLMGAHTNTVGTDVTRTFRNIGRGAYAIRLEYHPRVNTNILGSMELS